MSGHGHVIPNADGSLARCGGPGLCSECSREAAQLAMLAHCACGRPSQHASGWCGEVCGGWPSVSALARAWAWLRRCWGWLGAALVGLVLLIVGGSYLVRRLGRLRDEATFDEATARVAHLEGQREEVRAQRARTAAERARVEARVREIDRELRHERRLAIASFEGGEDLSDAEVERAYREVLGAR